MADALNLRYITSKEAVVEKGTWGVLDWLSRPGLTEAEQLLVIRVHIPPGKAHQFHKHPEQEEVIYVLEGVAEQWVEQDCRKLGPGDMVHIPADTVHGTYNYTDKELVVLAILSPAHNQGPLLVDVYDQKPWCDIKKPMPL